MSIDEKTLLEERKVLEEDFNTTKDRIAKVEKDLQKSYQKSEKIYQDYRKWYKKKYGKDIGPSSIPKKYLKGVK